MTHGCRSTIIPDGVVRIANNAFHSYARINNLVIPDSVTSIGDYAFALAYVSNLTVTSLTPPNISSNTFSDIN